MTTSVSIWEKQELLDPVDEIIRRGREDGLSKEDTFDLLLAQIPANFGDGIKATYLGFRALGFRPKQALSLLELEEDVLEVWKEETPELVEFELTQLPKLQKTVNADIIRLGFMRNMTMFLFRDSLTIKRGMVDIDSMTNREYNYFRSIRRFYGNGELLALQRALEPEKHRPNFVALSFNNNQFQVRETDGEGLEVSEVYDVSPREDTNQS